jgi:hypothetical protein
MSRAALETEVSMSGHERRRRGSLAAVQWRLADEIVALGEALRVADRPLEAADALVVLAVRACRELQEAAQASRIVRQ